MGLNAALADELGAVRAETDRDGVVAAAAALHLGRLGRAALLVRAELEQELIVDELVRLAQQAAHRALDVTYRQTFFTTQTVKQTTYMYLHQYRAWLGT